jgi:hypothetical protein
MGVFGVSRVLPDIGATSGGELARRAEGSARRRRERAGKTRKRTGTGRNAATARRAVATGWIRGRADQLQVTLA